MIPWSWTGRVVGIIYVMFVDGKLTTETVFWMTVSWGIIPFEVWPNAKPI